MVFFSGPISLVDFVAVCLPLDLFVGAIFAGPLPLDVFCLRFAAVRQALAAVYIGSSLTTKSSVILPANRQSFSPRGFVNSSNDLSVSSVWRQSFAYACQVSRRKRVSRIIFSWCLYSFGESPSKTGMIHC